MISDEKGYALPLVFVIMIVLAMLSTALWFYGTSETTQVSRQEKRARAYYYALSGIGITEKILDDDKGINLLKTGGDPFYLSGPLGSGPYDWDLAFTEPANGVDVAVEVNYEKVSDGLITGEIISEGHYLGITRIIKRDFIFVMLGSAFDLGWYRTQGNTTRIHWGENIDRSIDYPVEFVTDDNEPIHVNANADRFLEAPGMFFAIEPDSIFVESNSERVRLITNYILFDGNIIFEENNNNRGELALELRDEILSGKHLMDVPDYEDYLEPVDSTIPLGNLLIAENFYGVLCLGEDPDGVGEIDIYRYYNVIGNQYARDYILKDGEDSLLGRDWYLFPDLVGGLNLADDNDLKQLIRIIDISKFDFSMFGLGLKLGAYR